MDVLCNSVASRESDGLSPFGSHFSSGLSETKGLITDVPMKEDEIVTSVMVAGTTFMAVYGVVDGAVELISPDLGEGRAILAGRPADRVAKNLLWKMAREEVLRTEIPFMPDHRLAPAKVVHTLEKDFASNETLVER